MNKITFSTPEKFLENEIEISHLEDYTVGDVVEFTLKNPAKINYANKYIKYQEKPIFYIFEIKEKKYGKGVFIEAIQEKNFEATLQQKKTLVTFQVSLPKGPLKYEGKIGQQPILYPYENREKSYTLYYLGALILILFFFFLTKFLIKKVKKIKKERERKKFFSAGIKKIKKAKERKDFENIHLEFKKSIFCEQKEIEKLLQQINEIQYKREWKQSELEIIEKIKKTIMEQHK